MIDFIRWWTIGAFGTLIWVSLTELAVWRLRGAAWTVEAIKESDEANGPSRPWWATALLLLFLWPLTLAIWCYCAVRGESVVQWNIRMGRRLREQRARAAAVLADAAEIEAMRDELIAINAESAALDATWRELTERFSSLLSYGPPLATTPTALRQLKIDMDEHRARRLALRGRADDITARNRAYKARKAAQ